MRHKTIEKLVASVKRKLQDRPLFAPRNWERATHKADGRYVWSVQSADGVVWDLYHYERLVLTVRLPGQGLPLLVQEGGVVDLYGVSVSDQQGMNGFLDALGVLTPDTYVTRAGRTRKYA